MIKNTGFSLLEILIGISIAGIMAVVAAPSFSKMRREETFRSEVQGLFDAFSQARSNAMSNKMCTKLDGTTKMPAVAWSLKIKQFPNPFSYQLYCIWDETKLKSLDVNLDNDSYTEPQEENFFSDEFLENFGFFYDTSALLSAKNHTVDGSNVLIHFWTGSVQTTIIKDPYNTLGLQKRESEIKIIAKSIDNRSQTICLNKIQGFPTFNKNGSTCAD